MWQGAHSGLPRYVMENTNNSNFDLHASSTRTAMLCFPLHIVLEGSNLTCLDFLSLDLQGAEYGVLNATDWDRLRVLVLMAEAESKQNLVLVPQILQKQGYVRIYDFGNIDFVYVKQECLEGDGKNKPWKIKKILACRCLNR